MSELSGNFNRKAEDPVRAPFGLIAHKAIAAEIPARNDPDTTAAEKAVEKIPASNDPDATAAEQKRKDTNAANQLLTGNIDVNQVTRGGLLPAIKAILEHLGLSPEQKEEENQKKRFEEALRIVNQSIAQMEQQLAAIREELAR